MKKLSWDARRKNIYFSNGSRIAGYTLAEAQAIHEALGNLLEDVAANPQTDINRDVQLPVSGTVDYVHVEVGSKEIELLHELKGGAMNLRGLQDNGFTRVLLKLEALGYVTTYPIRGDAIGVRDVVITPEGVAFLKKTENAAAS